MRNTGLNEAQAGIKIVGRNINNPRYANVTTLMAEIEEELKNLLMHVKGESENTGLKLNIKNLNLVHIHTSPVVNIIDVWVIASRVFLCI